MVYMHMYMQFPVTVIVTGVALQEGGCNLITSAMLFCPEMVEIVLRRLHGRVCERTGDLGKCKVRLYWDTLVSRGLVKLSITPSILHGRNDLRTAGRRKEGGRRCIT
jgi:hypothetical protein